MSIFLHVHKQTNTAREKFPFTFVPVFSKGADESVISLGFPRPLDGISFLPCENC